MKRIERGDEKSRIAKVGEYSDCTHTHERTILSLVESSREGYYVLI